MAYVININATAEEMIKSISDRRIRQQLSAWIDRLANEPEKQGHALRGSLSAYRSCRAVGQRYRIIYLVESAAVVVIVVAAGIRKEGDKRDIYTLAQRLVRLGLLNP